MLTTFSPRPYWSQRQSSRFLFFGLIVLRCLEPARELRTFVLLIGPVLYFCTLHLVFASSMRYRIPGQMPAIGLAAIGWMTLMAEYQAPRAQSAENERNENSVRLRSILEKEVRINAHRTTRGEISDMGIRAPLSILGGGLWFAYWYITDSDTASKLIREEAIRFFPNAILDPGG